MNTPTYPEKIKQAIELINNKYLAEKPILATSKITKKISNVTDKGVSFICFSQEFIPRTMVAIQSLRKEYKGSISLYYHEEKANKDSKFDLFLEDMKVNIIALSTSDKSLSKIEVLDSSPYKYNILLDADTLILKPIDILFEKIKENGIMLHNFMDFTPKNSEKDIHLSQFKELTSLYPTALDYQRAVSGGIFGFTQGNFMVDALIELLKFGYISKFKNNFDCSLQLLAPHYKHYLIGAKYAMSCEYKNKRIDPVIVHFHDNQHISSNLLSLLWKDVYHSIDEIYQSPDRSDKYLMDYLTHYGK